MEGSGMRRERLAGTAVVITALLFIAVSDRLHAEDDAVLLTQAGLMRSAAE